MLIAHTLDQSFDRFVRLLPEYVIKRVEEIGEMRRNEFLK